jgi:molybdopterin adenylyltransferase
MNMNTLRIGLVSISDRASSGVYQDKGIPALEEWLGSALTTPFEIQTRLSRTNRRSLSRRCASWWMR